MLVLSRKNGERIHIGDDIVVEIRRIAGNRVTLAIKAPREVRILRGELEDAVKQFGDPSHDGSRNGAQPVSAELAQRSGGARDVITVPLDSVSPHDSGTYFAMP